MNFYPQLALKEPCALETSGAATCGAGRTPPFLLASNAKAKPRAPASPFEAWIARACSAFLDGLRQTIVLVTSSLTALGNQANAYFTQLSAFLAFDRMARSMEVFGFGFRPKPLLPVGHMPMLNAWSAFFAAPFHTCAAPWFASPFNALSDLSSAWASCFNPLMPGGFSKAVATPTDDKPPFTATFVMPGFTWGFFCDNPAARF